MTMTSQEGTVPAAMGAAPVSVLYTPQQRARRDATKWTLVQGILAPAQFLVFLVSLALVLRYLWTGAGYDIATLSIIGIVAEYTFQPRPILIYNPSTSQPVGWYKLNRNLAPKKGLRVAAYAPEWAREMADERGYLPYEYPLIKQVLAVEGDKICYYFGIKIFLN